MEKELFWPIGTGLIAAAAMWWAAITKPEHMLMSVRPAQMLGTLVMVFGAGWFVGNMSRTSLVVMLGGMFFAGYMQFLGEIAETVMKRVAKVGKPTKED